jgi:hypothetical protein
MRHLLAGCLLLIACGDSAPRPAPQPDALDKAVVVFGGTYTRQDIQQRLEAAMQLYGLPVTEANRERALSALIALRSRNPDRISEMQILGYMIRSYVPDTKITFPDAAGLSAAFLLSGEK